MLVAMSLGEARGSGQVLRVALAVVAPLLAGAFAVVCWLLVGRVLRPVAALTRGAAEITTTREAGRLPVSAAEDEIHRLAVTLNDMLDRLERSSARQRSFVADAAHELRSPLTAIRTQLEVGRAFPESTDWEHVTSEALADVDRLSRLVDDLLLLARLEDGPGPRTGAVDLAVVADEVVARASGPVRRVGHGSVPLHGDADALARVVANLVDNATRYARTGVTVEVIADGTHGRLVVSDDGPGISLADRERVFERFTRLDEARSRDAGGSGLGLAIVRELVRAHGGEVWLEDNEPGLRVVVRLPAAAAPGDPARHDGTQLGV